MDAIQSFVQYLESQFKGQIQSHTVLKPESGRFEPFPDSLAPQLQAVLRQDNINALYVHQREAFDTVGSGKNSLLVSRTASGKTLSFLLPILNDYLNADPPFSVLLMYPTKALSRDQEGTLGKLLRGASVDARIGTFDGDTPQDERSRIQRAADFVITNPDMLHAGILPRHSRSWRSFLSRLKYIVIDEVHIYRGAFGSHVANVFRRLQRVCSIHGSAPTIICSSATIGNPGEHVSRLFHREFHVINQDGAPRPRRDLYLVNPPLVQSHGFVAFRKGPASVSISLIRQAAKLGIRTICFCRARQQVERLHRSIVDGHDEFRAKVKPYRGGLLPNERRQLERDLFAGKINTIITTNALELGIDIGDLDICILSGHPGTIASFWQQAGRVGRQGSRAVIVYIANDAPVDQYLVNHADFIVQAPIERAWLNADNPYILLQHLPCAAHEHPLRESEDGYEERAYTAALEVLRQEKIVAPYHDCYRYAGRDYPARGVNLRGMTDYNIQICCRAVVIGEIDPIGARGTLYKDAIYQHLGRRYMSVNLDLDKKTCDVEEANVDYFTEAVWEGRVTMTQVETSRDVHGARLDFGYVNVNKQPKLYKKIRERSYENIGYGPITLEPFIYDTTGLCLLPPPTWTKAIVALDSRYVGAALFGLSYVLRRAAPSLCMGDVNDINTDISLVEEQGERWQSALFLYDTHEGGIGYAEKIFELLDAANKLCLEIIRECPCAGGCPSCVPPLPPGIGDAELESLLIESDAAVQCTESFLLYLLNGDVQIPKVTVRTNPKKKPDISATDDPELRKLQGRLTRAAGILKKKRERSH